MKKKKVLQVFSATHRGGAETMVMNILRDTDQNVYTYDFISHVKEKSDYDNEITSYGGNVIHTPSLGKVGYIKYVNNLREIIRTYGPYDAVHCHTNLQAAAVLMAAFLEKVPKRLAHSHNTVWFAKKNIKNTIWSKFSKVIIKKVATNYVACSKEAGIAMFGNKLVRKNKVKVINNGIEVKKFIDANNINVKIEKRKELGIDNNQFVIGHIGRYHHQKNHEFILNLAEILKQENIDVKFLLIGDGEKKAEVEKEIDDSGLSEYIIPLGVRSDIESLFSAFDLFVLPSHYEGLPLVLVEAQASGTISIVSNLVTKDIDLKLNLIKFKSINNVDIWKKEIVEIMKGKIDFIDKNHIFNSITEQGYNSMVNSKKFNEMYG